MIIMSSEMKKEFSDSFYKNEGIPIPKATLHLNLKKKWFDMIASGEKKEEYRDIKPYWNRVFCAHICIKGRFYHPTDVTICFSNGYAKDRRQMTVECLGLFQRTGKPEWGADPNKLYHTLLIGNIISKNFK